MYQASSDGWMVSRPLWAEFPFDENTWDITGQFLLGPGLLLSPVLTQGATSVSAYFPEGVWYSFADLSRLDLSSGGARVELSTPLTSTNVHLRGGVVFPTQQGGMTTTEARATPFTLYVPLSTTGSAEGQLFLDDGEQVSLEQWTYISYAATSNSVTATVEESTYAEADSLLLQTVLVLGVSTQPTSAVVDGVALASTQITYDSAKLCATFSSLNLVVSKSFELVWS
jgi:alpha-glucosidase (family GH31 glycosyl hydrolase)